ncbi:6298_t:CDS:2 [Funneliformis mosseae]|uniref:6298_t:CDS:1 n=1 Tax=Funneliformis mosseae TaxID=27381 RepID=A0A9N9A8J5_FUNMO|nr:6298_t:CDS:2 [Funneliformis mosseae]
MQLLYKEESETAKEFLNADEIDPQESTETAYHPQAIYTSRFLSFDNLPKPINSTGVQIEDSEGHIQLANVDDLIKDGEPKNSIVEEK